MRDSVHKKRRNGAWKEERAKNSNKNKEWMTVEIWWWWWWWWGHALDEKVLLHSRD